MNDAIDRRRSRAVMACVLVLVSIAVALAISSTAAFGSDEEAYEGASSNGIQSASYVGRFHQLVEEGSDEASALETLGFEVFVQGEDSIPSWFTDEIMGIADGVQLVMDDSGSLVSFFSPDDHADVLSLMTDSLAERGWTAYSGSIESDSGKRSGETEELEKSSVLQKTYFKKGGECRWLMITVHRADEGANVVMHIQHV